MAEVFYGRVAAYDRALAGSEADLAAAIARNVFPGESKPDDSPGVRRLAAYVLDQRAHLAGQPSAAIVSGKVSFREPST
jgi:cytochrome b pre-mRNA-processing protein 3